MGIERIARHHKTAQEVLQERGVSVGKIKIDAPALRRFHEDRREKRLDKESQLRRRFGESVEKDPRSVQLLGKKKTESLPGLMFEDEKDSCVYYVKEHKDGNLTLANVLIPIEGKRGKKYSY